jgi:predicted DNA-binding transcriptional regulator AlpA
MSGTSSQDDPHPTRMLSEADLASRWQVSRRTVQRWRQAGHLPKPFRIGRKFLYRIESIDDFEAMSLVDRGGT